MVAKIEMYTTSSCPYCIRAKELLNKKGASYKEFNIQTNPQYMADMQRKNPGARTVPQIFINDQIIGGYDDMAALDRDGKLDDLLAKDDKGNTPPSSPSI